MSIPVERYGIPWPPWVFQDHLDTWRDYDIRDDDVVVASYPKSGTNWVREIVTLINANGNLEYIDRNQLSHPIEFTHEPALKKKDGPPIIYKAKNWTSPRVFQTHVIEECLPKELRKGQGKAIYMIRNPKDVAVSKWNFNKCLPKPKQTWDEFFDTFIDGKCLYGHWYNHVKQYWQQHKHSSNFLFLYYEDLKKDHKGGIVQISNFLGRTLSDEIIDKVVEHSSFKAMTKTHHLARDCLQQSQDSANSDTRNHDLSTSNDSQEHKVGPPGLLRKGIVGDWKNQFTVNQNERFNSIYKKEMQGSGIKIEYD